MLRVLVVSQCFWPEEFRINQVVADLVAEGAEVTVLTGQPNYPAGTVFPGYRAFSAGRQRHDAEYDIVRVPVVPRGPGGAIHLALNYLSFVAGGILVGSWMLRRQRFDVVFVYGTSPAIQGFVATWLGWLKHVPVVQWVQDLWPHALSATGYVRSPALLGMVDRLVRAMYRRSDLVLGQSHAYVQFLHDQAGATPVGYLPNPGEHPGDVASSPSASSGFDVVFAGNLGRAQALDTVVAAAALLCDLPNVRIMLYGAGSSAEWVRNETSRRGLTNVLLPGRVSPDAIRAVYARASVLLLTLVDDPMLARTVPSKLQSYLAAGVPIVAAVSGEAAVIVTASGSGLSCRAGDPQALADAVRRLYQMTPEERHAFGTAGRRYFDRHYRPDVLAKRLLAGLSQVAARTPAHAFGGDTA